MSKISHVRNTLAIKYPLIFKDLWFRNANGAGILSYGATNYRWLYKI